MVSKAEQMRAAPATLDSTTISRLQKLVDGTHVLGIVMLNESQIGPVGDPRRAEIAAFCERNGLYGKTYEVNDETVVRRPRADETIGLEIVERWS